MKKYDTISAVPFKNQPDFCIFVRTRKICVSLCPAFRKNITEDKNEHIKALESSTSSVDICSFLYSNEKKYTAIKNSLLAQQPTKTIILSPIFYGVRNITKNDRKRQPSCRKNILTKSGEYVRRRCEARNDSIGKNFHHTAFDVLQRRNYFRRCQSGVNSRALGSFGRVSIVKCQNAHSPP